jgi:disulfide bond formation protein DsbB
VVGELGRTRVFRCDEAPWEFLGLSLAGWNVLASLLLMAGAVVAARKASRA